MFHSRSARCVPYSAAGATEQGPLIPPKNGVNFPSATTRIPIESEKEIFVEEVKSLPDPHKSNKGPAEEATHLGPPPAEDHEMASNNPSGGPEITEVSTAANIRLLHKVSELQDMVAMWAEFREMGTDGEGSDYLVRCYIGEILSSWQHVKRGYNDIVWLRENGNGTALPTQLERAVSELLGKVGEWRNKNMPRRHPHFNRRSLPSHWSPGSQGAYMGRPHCMHRCAPVPMIYGPCKKDCGCAQCSGRQSPTCCAPPMMESRAEATERRKSRALGLADLISSALQNFNLTREQLCEEINVMRKDLLKSQEEWVTKRSGSDQYEV